MTFRRHPVEIDRDPQALPVPIGGMAPVRVRRRVRRRPLRAHLDSLVSAAGVAAGIAGIALLLVPAMTSASLSRGIVQVGGMSLVSTGAGGHTWRYGGAASLVLDEPGDGSAVASAAWASGGAVSSALCRLRRAAARLVDECRYDVGGEHLTSVDVLDPATGSAWQRTYGDGTHVTIAVDADGAAVPVPFPIGH